MRKLTVAMFVVTSLSAASRQAPTPAINIRSTINAPNAAARRSLMPTPPRNRFPTDCSTHFSLIESSCATTLPALRCPRKSKEAGVRLMEGSIDQRHVGAGHEFFDVQQDQHLLIDRREPRDVLGVEGGGGEFRSGPDGVNRRVRTSDTASTTTPTTRPATFRMITTVNSS